MLTKTKFEPVEMRVWSEGEAFTVYGIAAFYEDGRWYRCDDISCYAEDVERLIRIMEENDTPYEDLPYIIEDFVNSF